MSSSTAAPARLVRQGSAAAAGKVDELAAAATAGVEVLEGDGDIDAGAAGKGKNWGWAR
jgi:hypothetical protein